MIETYTKDLLPRSVPCLVTPYPAAMRIVLAREPAYREIHNDADGQVVNLFACLRGDKNLGAKVADTPRLLKARGLSDHVDILAEADAELSAQRRDLAACLWLAGMGLQTAAEHHAAVKRLRLIEHDDCSPLRVIETRDSVNTNFLLYDRGRPIDNSVWRALTRIEGRAVVVTPDWPDVTLIGWHGEKLPNGLQALRNWQ